MTNSLSFNILDDLRLHSSTFNINIKFIKLSDDEKSSQEYNSKRPWMVKAWNLMTGEDELGASFW
jgi:hypothetical protein